jgi:hypothetical protein
MEGKEEEKVVVDPHKNPVLSDESFAKRQETYAMLGQAGPDEEETPAEEVITPPEEGVTEDLDSEEEPQDAETSPEEEVAEDLDSEEEPQDEEKKKKMVPYDALHESRAETREAKDRIKLLENQMSEVIGSYQELVKTKQQVAPEVVDESPIEDVDEAIRQLQRENKELKANITQSTAQHTRDVQANQQVQFQKEVDTVDKELATEGYVGFSKFQRQVVDAIMAIKDPDERASYQNSEGWKRIWKERVYPDLSRTFVKQVRKKKFAEKDAAAEKASLLEKSGKVKEVKPKGNNNTFKDYLDARAKAQVF